MYENIGRISMKEDEWIFLWTIPTSRIMKIEEDICLASPRFHLPDSSWYLTLKNGQSKEWIGLFLNRADIGSPKMVKYTIEVDPICSSNKFSETCMFDRRIFSSGEPKLFKMSMIDVLYSIENSSDVEVSCRIKDYSFTSLQETPNTVSCAIQTEVPDSVIDKENSKDVDGSSFDTKEDTILRDRMNQLLIKGSDYDVTICVQDKKFRAHRIILSARSPVFAMMLAHDTKENNTGTINIEDCDPDSFDEFLLYVYSGRTENLTPSKALQLYYTADKYDFPVLKERCVSLLKTSLSIKSICDVILLAAKHQEKELLELASEFFTRNMEEILVSVSWQNFMIQNPVEANELYIKSMKILVPRK